jgi:hypothetical protein
MERKTFRHHLKATEAETERETPQGVFPQTPRECPQGQAREAGECDCVGLPTKHPLLESVSRDEASLVKEEEARPDEEGRC